MIYKTNSIKKQNIMGKIVVKDYLKDGQGKPSSKRLFSLYMLRFFFAFNSIIWPLIIGLAYVASGPALDINWIIALLSFDFMLLLSVYAPAQLGKMSEVKEIIGLAKAGTDVEKILTKPEDEPK